MRKKSPFVGSTLDALLVEEGLYDTALPIAIKRALAWQIQGSIAKESISKAEMARRMHTSRAALNRLLDAENGSVTLRTLARAAAVLGKELRLEIVDVVS